MPRLLISAAAVALLSTTAFAADLSTPPPEATPSYEAARPFSWTGCYAGVNGGYGWGSSKWSDAFVGTFADDRPNGFLAGGQIGCNYQFNGGFVLGLEGEGDWAKIIRLAITTMVSGTRGPTQLKSTGSLQLPAGLAMLGTAACFPSKAAGQWRAPTFDDTGNNGLGTPLTTITIAIPARATAICSASDTNMPFTQHLTGLITYEFMNFGSEGCHA